jgi:phage baseplate assembly protein W
VSNKISGPSFPFRVVRPEDAPATKNGFVTSAAGEEKIRENLIHILLTGVGERVMMRDYGGGLRDLVHDPNNEALWAVIQHQVGKSVSRLEPRVLLQSLTVSGQAGTLVINITYVLRQTRQPRTLSVPIGLGGL